MVHYLIENPTIVIGKHVCELGAGTGLVGLVAAALGATDVRLTDVPPIVSLLEKNIQYAASQHCRLKTMVEQKRLVCSEYDWQVYILEHWETRLTSPGTRSRHRSTRQSFLHQTVCILNRVLMPLSISCDIISECQPRS